MNCGDWEERIAAEFDRELSPGGFSTEILRHLGACEACAALASGLERDRAALACAPTDVSEPDYAALRSELRAALVRKSIQRDILRRKLARRYVPALLAAAAAVTFALVVPRPQPHRQGAGATRVTAAAQMAAAQVPVRGAPAPPTPVQRPARRQTRQNITPSVDLALWQKVTGRGWPPDDSSESRVEMQIETANPNVTIILLRAKEGSDE